ncbi:MAG: FkbM family methyltransferase [Thermoplasmataceae archaeon]
MLNDKDHVFRYKDVTLTVPQYSFFIPYATFFSGEYDFLQPGKKDIVIDAGANIGDYTLRIADKVKTVIAIEPSIENLSYLKKNTMNIKNVRIVERAIGNEKSLVSFSGDGVSASVDNKGKISVEIDTLDNICEELKIAPTILKMDIEGYEGDALKGFEHHMSSVRRMVIEVHSDQNKRDCEEVLTRNGFMFRYQRRMDIVKRTLKNVTSHPLSFIKYDRLNGYYASKVMLKFPINRKTSIPACGEMKGMYLLEVWK